MRIPGKGAFFVALFEQNKNFFICNPYLNKNFAFIMHECQVDVTIYSLSSKYSGVLDKIFWFTEITRKQKKKITKTKYKKLRKQKQFD